MNPEAADEVLIASIISYQKQHLGDDVRLITDDAVYALRADHLAFMR